MILFKYIDSTLFKNANKIYLKPFIPRNKIKNAIDSFCYDVNFNDVHILIDETLFGSAKDSIVITNDTVWGKDGFNNKFMIHFSDIYYIEVKKGLINSSLIINDEKVFTFTQASYKDLDLIFCGLCVYIYETYHPEELDEDSQEENSNVSSQNIMDEEEPTTSYSRKITKREELNISESYPQEIINEESLNISGNYSEESTHINQKLEQSVFKPTKYGDGLLKYFETLRETSNKVTLGILDVLSGEKTVLEDYRDEIKKLSADINIYIRDNYINKRNIVNLKNDMATVETIIFIFTIFRSELVRNRIPNDMINFLVYEGISSIFNDNVNTRDLVRGMNKIVMEKMPIDNEKIIGIFYLVRILLSNNKGYLCNIPDDFFAPDFDNYIHNEVKVLLQDLMNNKLALGDTEYNKLKRELESQYYSSEEIELKIMEKVFEKIFYEFIFSVSEISKKELGSIINDDFIYNKILRFTRGFLPKIKNIRF
ncbi:hypothetical protein [Pasteurella atlantica]|uniref:hypothetical protein n=1 Tax=Pasteurellaceae TaxID=712 RepID=UPI0027614796|nr:hypothetical protein [Pasteurella atlantica]MDP8098821.1 hypothetical protein [Pasteurella atlantica]MDP8106260.1 hypothetical protein [Pasteurella atlantica]MDP8115989.1 hypothetical protein [Pasteurella atlantica]